MAGDVQNIVDAVTKAFAKHDTEAIKGILRQGCHAHYIFASVTDSSSRLSARDLFLQVNATVPGNFDHRYFIPNYDDLLCNVLLHLAAYISDYELITLLVEQGADITSTETKGRTALNIASQYASLEIVKFLIENSPTQILDLPAENGYALLKNACLYNCPKVVQFLLSQGISVTANEKKRIPILISIFHKDAEYVTPVVSLLLDDGAKINLGNHALGTPLILAINSAYIAMNHSADSSYSSYVDLCFMLIKRGCDVNAAHSDGKTALHFAIKRDLETVVRKLLISGSDIDSRDVFGNTALHFACRNGSKRLVDLLIISGADLRAIDRETTLIQWRSLGKLNERNTQLLNYVINESKQCLSLENMCHITIRKYIRNVEKDAIHLGLPALLMKRIQLKD
ncbi:putative ankyrin repeat protein RF_0381 [Stegodyphus dumicola]|uniref:putative ankyrin repeat protein RF_0381 n=1 Tax=Stegodyphus dumicola TaxID=202533 RepID=UPI0015A83C64|nr:putative ankyrin repeat protein RF_0381 [Stegodyphus dumicola]